MLNDRIGTVGAPQGLLPVEVVPASAAQARAVDGYLASTFELLVVPGFVGTFELRSTLEDGSINTLIAVDPSELEIPRLLARGTVGLGKTFTVAIEPWTADGVVCARVPITLTASAGSACRVVRLLPASFYNPNERIKYEVVGEVLDGLCELVAQYDQAEIEATLGADFYASLPAAITGPVTIALEVEIVMNPPRGVSIDTGGRGSSSGGGGWD